MSWARGSSRSRKKKGSPALGAPTVIYPQLEGGNPFEPGTKNYKKLLDIRRRLYEVSSKRPCGFTISAPDPFSPDNFRGASKFNAFVPDKTLFPGPRLKESKIACPPSQDDVFSWAAEGEEVAGASRIFVVDYILMRFEECIHDSSQLNSLLGWFQI
ncbi:uncharacterized protein LOC112169634 isoform X2 [Rosa chinensis]|uniref:uncharacterized protein LOC112169634 isoform X2 n=1 Tax=Rosa chinensis TaxID=74649 RepID=UPI001AD8C3F7|nr:uncharacterized protein LOC112169634 isoform X2 [Rosa chinensis]